MLVRFGDDDELTAEVGRRVREGGIAWMSGTTWQEQGAMRISVSNWRTTEADVDAAVAAVLRAAGTPAASAV